MTKKPASDRRAIAAWCLFDFGNSAFTTVIITAVFNVYFVTQIAPEGGERLWSIALVLTNLLIILTAPLIGAVADHGGRKKKFLFYSWIACIIGTACLSLVGPGDAALAIFLVIVANTAFASGENLISAFLPEIAKPDEVAKVSAWGWGVGYIGGLVALAICLFASHKLGKDLGDRYSGIIVAAFFFIGGLPTFLYIKERNTKDVSLQEAFRTGISESIATIRDRHRLSDLFRFFVAALVLQIGIYGVIQYAGIYGVKLAGLAKDDVVLILLISQIAAFFGAMTCGKLAQMIGTTNTIRATTVIWFLAGLLLLVKPDRPGFWAAALTAGFAMGASLSAVRATVALFTPPGRSGEIFGFWGLFGRIAAVLAPAGNALLLYATDDKLESGIVYFLGCFALSYFLLARVNEDRGRTTAENFVQNS